MPELPEVETTKKGIVPFLKQRSIVSIDVRNGALRWPVSSEVFQIKNHNGRLDLQAVMMFLGQKQINAVLVEAGAVLNGALLEQGLVDEWLVYMAPCVLGDQGRGLFHLPAAQTIADKKQFKMSSVRQVGPDLRLTFKEKG